MTNAETLNITFDQKSAAHLLSTLSHAFERFPEFGELVFSFLDSEVELFSLDSDKSPTSLASEVLVRLHPSDALFGLVTTFRARNPDFSFFEHLPTPVVLANMNTTSESHQ